MERTGEVSFSSRFLGDKLDAFRFALLKSLKRRVIAPFEVDSIRIFFLIFFEIQLRKLSMDERFLLDEKLEKSIRERENRGCVPLS